MKNKQAPKVLTFCKLGHKYCKSLGKGKSVWAEVIKVDGLDKQREREMF